MEISSPGPHHGASWHGVRSVVHASFLFGCDRCDLRDLRVAGTNWPAPHRTTLMFRFYLISMAMLAWLTVVSGAHIIYPWAYRAWLRRPARRIFRCIRATTAALQSAHSRMARIRYGMEREHRLVHADRDDHGGIRVHQHTVRGSRFTGSMRNAVLGFTAVAFFATAVAGGFGALTEQIRARARRGANSFCTGKTSRVPPDLKVVADQLPNGPRCGGDPGQRVSAVACWGSSRAAAMRFGLSVARLRSGHRPVLCQV